MMCYLIVRRYKLFAFVQFGGAMTKILMCTGKKDKVIAVMKHWANLDKQGFVRILGKRMKTKRALIWSYDELKILYDQLRDGPAPLPPGILKSLDIFQVKDQSLIVVKFSSKAVEDVLLKSKILALVRPFLGKQVTVRLEETEIRHNDYKIERKCTGQITGPVKSVMAYRELLEKEQLCDPKTVTYLF